MENRSFWGGYGWLTSTFGGVIAPQAPHRTATGFVLYVVANAIYAVTNGSSEGGGM